MLRAMDLSFGLERKLWSVSELTRHIRQALESDYRLQDAWVEGEVSNLGRPASGHLYFTLLDESASLRCVMWRSEVDRQTVLPKEGERFEVHGHISVYEAGGQYQLYADQLRLAGEGALFQEFLRLKAKLEAEGLFDPERKRSLPEWPARIGVVTSPTGAALQDVVNVLARRYPLLEVFLAPTAVQGKEAPIGIVAGLKALNHVPSPPVDAILIVRGGGSAEDLAAFSDEAVARAVAESAAPVVSGVGHETDLVIADFVADVRAPTPSAAAEVVSPDGEGLMMEARQNALAITARTRERLIYLRSELQNLMARLRLASPRAQVANARQRVDEFTSRGNSALRYRLSLARSDLEGLGKTLVAIGPPAVLARGFAMVFQSDGNLLRSVSDVDRGSQVRVQLQDGGFEAQVGEVETTEELDDRD
jgi:exodeoxyribonuclease VII large subunit